MIKDFRDLFSKKQEVNTQDRVDKKFNKNKNNSELDDLRNKVRFIDDILKEEFEKSIRCHKNIQAKK